MFGYVTVNKPELKIKDYEKYRMYYCGVCHALKHTDGAIGQMSLTYDTTFAAVLLTALYEPETAVKKQACMIHPTQKKQYLENDVIQYVADMNLILSYYKCLDDWNDDRSYPKLIYSSMIRKKVRELGKKYGQKIALIRNRIQTLAACERKNVKNLDLLSGIFGDIMGEILAYKPEFGEDFSEDLRKLGYELGKYVYLLDAYDDIKEDIRKRRFNPLVDLYRKMTFDEFRAYMKELLMMIAADLAKDYERLPIVDETGILRNIIYSGIWVRFENGKEERKGKKA